MIRVLGIRCESCNQRAPVMALDEFRGSGRLSSEALDRIRRFTSRHGGGAPERQRERVDRHEMERARVDRQRLAGHVPGPRSPVVPAVVGLLHAVGKAATARACVVRPCWYRAPERTSFSGVCYVEVGDRICGRPWPCDAHVEEASTGDEASLEAAE